MGLTGLSLGVKAESVTEHAIRSGFEMHVIGAKQQASHFSISSGGGRTPKAGGRLLDGRTWDEFPESKGRWNERD